MDKQKKINLAKIVSFSAITASVLTLLSVFAFKPIPREKTAYGGFYTERENSLDLVLVGNSTTREGYIPAEAWHRYGITSHTIGSNPTHLEVIKIAIDEIARTQRPKLVYVDVNGLTFQNKESQNSYVKDFINSMPDGEWKDELKKKYPYVNKSDGFELFKEHNNWRNQYWWESKLFNTEAYNKGYDPQTAVLPISPVIADPDYVDAEWLDIDPGLIQNPNKVPHTPRDYLNEILAVAKKYPHIDFIFGEMPRTLSDDSIRQDMILERYYRLRACKPIVEEAGFEWIDFIDKVDEIGINPLTDQRDGDHLNHRGAKRFTKYFAKLVSERYDLNKDTYRDPEIVEEFNSSYEKYLQNVDSKLMAKMKIPEDYNE